jgi:hypothetical protein
MDRLLDGPGDARHRHRESLEQRGRLALPPPSHTEVADWKKAIGGAAGAADERLRGGAQRGDGSRNAVSLARIPCAVNAVPAKSARADRRTASLGDPVLGQDADWDSDRLAVARRIGKGQRDIVDSTKAQFDEGKLERLRLIGMETPELMDPRKLV